MFRKDFNDNTRDAGGNEDLINQFGSLMDSNKSERKF